MTRVHLIDALLQDVRFGVRTLGRQKGWTAAGILTLALGIGATTAVFSTVSSLLLHPLPWPDAGRLAIVYQQPTAGNHTGMSVQITPQPASLRAWREGAHSFEDLQGWTTSDVTLQPPAGQAAILHAASILPGFPRFTGQQPLIGRAIQDEDIAAGGKVALIGEGLWRSRFASDPHVLGTTLTLDGSVYVVAGVMPASFQLPALMQPSTDIWLPLDLRQTTDGLSIVGRLRPGATHADAAAELDRIDARILTAGGHSANLGFRSLVVAPRELARFSDSLELLTAAVVLVLIIACANVAHLLLARGATRQRELAIRAALGAGTGRLRRQLITESLVLALAGCAGGVLLGKLGLHALVAMRPPSLSQLDAARLDGTTLLVTIVLSVITGLVFGLVGSSQSSQLAAPEGLRAGSLATSHGRRHTRLRSLLVVTEMAISAALLVGATLLVRSVISLQATDPGFEAHGLYAINIQLPRATYRGPARHAFFEAIAERGRRVPGVDAVTIAAAAPPGRSFQVGALEIEGEPPPAPGTTSFVDFNGVGPEFFQVMGIALVQGTTFTDTTDAAGQVIVNEAMAKAHWAGRSPVGHRLRVTNNGQGDWKTIVGVAHNAITGGLMMETSTPMYYEASTGGFPPSAILRVSRPGAALPALRAIVADLDPRLPAVEIASVEEAMSQSIAGPRFTMTLLAVFTGLAVLLAAVGLYGVMSYAVAQRTREIGIRIALGATRRRIARAVLAQGLALGVIGMVVGLVAARMGTRLLRDMLTGVTMTDPLSFAIAGAGLLGVTVVACVVPMTRAVSVEPLIAMRAE